ncbi:MAG: hypothetical protein JEZ01_17210 [Labilibaculum sp.]|jgi:hypothetical protein|nr:hypothetical protein [Labilibaculum sp.]MBI9059506.1 hypothetical protein [Labilibaculum sp.]
MYKRKRNWVRLLTGGALASGLLTIILYGLVNLQMLSEELAIPWTIIRDDVLMVDWTCLYIVLFATALLFGLGITNINGLKGTIGGLAISALLILTCALLDENVFGVGYYILSHLLWGFSFGYLFHQRNKLIIRQL